MEERYIPRRLYHIASVITEADKRFQDSGQGGHARADNRGDISLTRGKSLTLLYPEQGLLSRGACEQMEGVAKWYE